MRKFTEQLKKRSESVKLRGFERKDLRERLVSYMEYHPLSQDLKDKQLLPVVPRSQTASVLRVSMFSRYVGVLTMFLLIMVPVVAEKTVPGDVLYPVKVRFNEEIRSTLAFSPYQKVEWETERLERRIAEARLLANEGKLTPEVEEAVAEAVKQHSDAAQREIAAIRINDSEEAVIAEITLASALEVQSEVLAGHTAKDADPGNFGRSVAGLSGAVDAARKNVEETQSSEKPSYAKLSARVELETTRAQELFNSVSQNASEEEIANVEKRINNINTKIARAIELYNSKDKEVAATLLINTEPENSTTTLAVEEPGEASAAPSTTPQTLPEVDSGVEIDAEVATTTTLDPETEAIRLMREALMDTQKLISFMTDIDVRENVSIDELVPVEETEAPKADEKATSTTFEENIVSSNMQSDSDLGLDLDI